MTPEPMSQPNAMKRAVRDTDLGHSRVEVHTTLAEVGYIWDPRDFSPPGGMVFVPTSDDTRDDEPPIPGDDDWEGPADADELRECQHRHPSSRCRNCAETYG